MVEKKGNMQNKLKYIPAFAFKVPRAPHSFAMREINPPPTPTIQITFCFFSSKKASRPLFLARKKNAPRQTSSK